MFALLLVPGLFLLSLSFINLYRVIASDYTLGKLISASSKKRMQYQPILKKILQNPFSVFVHYVVATRFVPLVCLFDFHYFLACEKLTNQLKGILNGRDATMSLFFVLTHGQDLTSSEINKIFEFTDSSEDITTLAFDTMEDLGWHEPESKYYYRQIRK